MRQIRYTRILQTVNNCNIPENGVRNDGLSKCDEPHYVTFPFTLRYDLLQKICSPSPNHPPPPSPPPETTSCLIQQPDYDVYTQAFLRSPLSVLYFTLTPFTRFPHHVSLSPSFPVRFLGWSQECAGSSTGTTFSNSLTL